MSQRIPSKPSDPAAEDAARRAALAARLRRWARLIQALTFVIGVYIAFRTVRRGGSIAAADKADLILAGIAIVVGLVGLLRGGRRATVEL